MKTRKGIPVSEFCQNGLFLTIVMPLACCLTFAFLAYLGIEILTKAGVTSPAFMFLGTIVIVGATTVFTTAGIIYSMKFRKRAFQKNKGDHEQSLQLEKALNKFISVNVSNCPVPDKEIGGSWKAFRVEHFLSNSLRAQFSGNFTGLFAGTIKGYLGGFSVPNLLDSSSVLFLESESGETLRVLIPSTQAIEEMLIKTIEGWKEHAPIGTHVSKVLHEFSLKDENFIGPLSHPAFLDRLDASRRLPFKEKPSVFVRGILLQEGLSVGTAIESEGKQKMFFPTAFLKELSSEIASILNESIKEPKAIEAVV